jgi:hypothetical protein
MLCAGSSSVRVMPVAGMNVIAVRMRMAAVLVRTALSLGSGGPCVIARHLATATGTSLALFHRPLQRPAASTALDPAHLMWIPHLGIRRTYRKGRPRRF